VELLFGSTGPAGTIHVRRVDEDAVYAVRGYSSWRFSERAEDWIDKVYFSAPRERIAHVAITVVDDQAKETTSFSLERTGEEGWVLLGAGDGRSPADNDKLDTLLRAMSRVSLSELIGRIDDEDVAFGDPVAEIRFGLVAPRAELEPGDTDELGAGAEGDADTTEFEIEETLTLRVALAPGESERYWLHAEGSEFVVEVARWTIRELLEAGVEDFQAVVVEEKKGEEDADADKTPEIGEADDTDDPDETDNTREDDAEGETSHRNGGEAG